MDNHPTLDGLVTTLFATNALSSWQIFEDKRNIVHLRLRFTKQDTNVSSDDQNTSFRRKSDNQVKRDRERARRHKDSRTSSPIRDRPPTRASKNTFIEKPRDSESTALSEPVPSVEVSPVRGSQFTLSTESLDHSKLADCTANLSTSLHTSVNNLELLDQHDDDNIKSLNSECVFSDAEISHVDDNLPPESDISTEFDITKLETEIIYISKHDKFHKWLAITKCDKCWNRYAFYDIDTKGPWALYCPSPDHTWSDYVCSDCYSKTVHFKKQCKMRVVKFIREK